MIQDELLAQVLNEIDTFVCVVDAETKEICYMNKEMRKEYGLSEPVGRKCWDILHAEQKKMCEFCIIPDLLREKIGTVRVWTEAREQTGKIYRHADQLIEYNGRLLDVQCSSDITDFVKVSEDASMDELTGIFNRRAGREQIQILLDRAKQENKPVSLTLCDVNELKHVNDFYGHLEGDRMLCQVAKALREGIGEEDIVCRFSGDEFVVLFYGKNRETAEESLEQILLTLQNERISSAMGYEMSFSYGTEEIFPEEGCDLYDALRRTDAKMYTQKRSYRIQRARNRLKYAPAYSTLENFEYNSSLLYEALTASFDNQYIFVGNLRTGTFRYPPEMVEDFGLPGEIIENAAAFWYDLVHPQDKDFFLISNQEIADGRTEYHDIEYRAKNVRGEWVWLRCRGRMIRGNDGKPDIFAGTITNQGKINAIDQTTGLYNKYEFESSIKDLVVRDFSGENVCIMLLNIDGFKQINDLYDLAFGDLVLRIAAQKIYNLLPDYSMLYRLDGDEFGILLRGCSEKEGLALYKRIQRTFKGPQEYDDKQYLCTFSAGCVSYPKDGKDYLDLLKYANYALEYAKMSGKNRLTVFSQHILEQKTRKLGIVDELRKAMSRGFEGFSVYYQPIVHTRTREVVGAEALARWKSQKYGNVSPSEFIPLMEQNELITRFGKWVFSNAVQQCRLWSKTFESFHMSINVSYVQILEGSLLQFMQDTLEKQKVNPSRIIIELTENYLIQKEKPVEEFLRGVNSMGILMAMDDFGTGYSSAQNLKNIPFDIVKLDGTFGHDIHADAFNSSYVKFVGNFLGGIGKMVCLEGVETEEEYNIVKDYDIDFIQGFYFGRPVPASEFEEKYLKQVL